jgi:hypothetical protein
MLLLTPRRGAVSSALGTGTLITSAPSFWVKGCSALALDPDPGPRPLWPLPASPSRLTGPLSFS